MYSEARKIAQHNWYTNLNIVESKNVCLIDSSTITIHADSISWLGNLPDNSIDAIVTDPPYGVKEFELEQIDKMKTGKGGIWRLPPSFDGNKRAPLPRFTALNEKELQKLEQFFVTLGELMSKKLKPGGHAIIASNSFLSQLVFGSLTNQSLEFRGEIIRLVRTMRGGDKPKNNEVEFPGVCTLPRGCYEPWGLFRKKLPQKMTVGECLRIYGTGGLRRIDEEKPFEDVIQSSRTSSIERKIAEHPSLKPQEFLRKITYAVLPLGEGVILDPFMGSGSTLAAAKFHGYRSVGIEINEEFFSMANKCIPLLAKI